MNRLSLVRRVALVARGIAVARRRSSFVAALIAILSLRQADARESRLEGRHRRDAARRALAVRSRVGAPRLRALRRPALPALFDSRAAACPATSSRSGVARRSDDPQSRSAPARRAAQLTSYLTDYADT